MGGIAGGLFVSAVRSTQVPLQEGTQRIGLGESRSQEELVWQVKKGEHTLPRERGLKAPYTRRS